MGSRKVSWCDRCGCEVNEELINWESYQVCSACKSEMHSLITGEFVNMDGPGSNVPASKRPGVDLESPLRQAERDIRYIYGLWTGCRQPEVSRNFAQEDEVEAIEKRYKLK